MFYLYSFINYASTLLPALSGLFTRSSIYMDSHLYLPCATLFSDRVSGHSVKALGELAGWHTPVIPSLRGETEAGGSLQDLDQPELYSKILSQNKTEMRKQIKENWARAW